MLQEFRPEVNPVVWAIALKLDPARFRHDRDGVIAALASDGIETRPGFYPFAAMPVYNTPPLPVCQDVGANLISVPSFASLPDADIDFICDRLLQLRR